MNHVIGFALTPQTFERICERHDRVALSGAVKSGKSLLLDEVVLDRAVHHTDDVRARVSFADAPAMVLHELQGVPKFVVAGMLVPHVLAAGLVVDAAVWIHESLDPTMGPSEGLLEILEAWAEKTGRPLFAYLKVMREGEPWS